MSERPPRILLADDEQAIQTLLSYPLQKDGYEVVRASDGRDALARFGEQTFDLVVLDVMMPSVDGLEVCRRLRARSTVPIIMLTAKAEEIDKVLGLELGADGSGAELLCIPAGGGRQPVTPEIVGTSAQYIHMVGSEIYKFGVRVMVDAVLSTVHKAGLRLADIDLFVPHQANSRIIESAAERLGLAPERVMVNVERYGNTSAASIPIALCEAEADGKLDDGNNVVFVAFGGGLAWAAGVVRWGTAGVCRDPECRRRREPVRN